MFLCRSVLDALFYIGDRAFPIGFSMCGFMLTYLVLTAFFIDVPFVVNYIIVLVVLPQPIVFTLGVWRYVYVMEQREVDSG